MFVTGKVQFFDNTKGYGFISKDGGGEDVFFHHSKIQMSYKNIDRGQKVSFMIAQAKRGLQAIEIKFI